MELADFLRKAREKAGLTQIEVANTLGYSTSQFVSNWERGRSIPPLNTIRPLSKMYGMAMDQLFEQILKESIRLAEESLKKQYSAIKKNR